LILNSAKYNRDTTAFNYFLASGNYFLDFTTSPPNTHHTCDTSGGYHELHDGPTSLCIRLHKFQVHWDNARSFCERENADLVVLDTNEKALLLREYATS